MGFSGGRWMFFFFFSFFSFFFFTIFQGLFGIRIDYCIFQMADKNSTNQKMAEDGLKMVKVAQMVH